MDDSGDCASFGSGVSATVGASTATVGSTPVVGQTALTVF